MKPPAKVSSSRTPNRQHRKRKKQSHHPSPPRPNRRHPRNSKWSRPAQDWMQISSSTRPWNAYGRKRKRSAPPERELRQKLAEEWMRIAREAREGANKVNAGLFISFASSSPSCSRVPKWTTLALGRGPPRRDRAYGEGKWAGRPAWTARFLLCHRRRN
jgi:hypothetical protein